MSGIRGLVTGYLLRLFSTGTLLFCGLLAAHALVVMALFGALVFGTGQEPFAKCLTSRYGIRARLSLSAQQLFNSVVARRTISDTLGVSLTRFTRAFMTNLFTIV
jgi:hypothetical protein